MNITDYLKWRGEIPFWMSSFNEVDNLILSQICYLRFDKIVPPGTSMPLYQAVEQYLQQNPDYQETLSSYDLKRLDLTITASKCERFRSVSVSECEAVIDEETQMQFAAVTFILPDRIRFVAFAGTGSRLVGWKENLNMTYLKSTPSQQEAVRYLKKIIGIPFSDVMVGGHSKGGNLAVYAAVMQNDPRQIIAVYNNDGPGFSSEFLQTEAYKALKEKIITFIPQNSVIGRLMNSTDDVRIIHSTGDSLLGQHDVFSWQIDVTRIMPAPDNTSESDFLEEVLNRWNHELTYEEKYVFLNTVYQTLDEAGVTTTIQLARKRTEIAKIMITKYPQMPETTRHIFISVMAMLVKTNVKVFQKIYLDKYLKRSERNGNYENTDSE